MSGIAVANPVFLWMLPAAALPILFHLFFRIRKRQRPFSSLMFFLRADPRMNARRRLREWLALILRVLGILLFLLAAARPVVTGTGKGAASAVALLIDNSGSMSAATPDGTTCLGRALEAAGVLVGDLRPGDRAAIVLLVDEPSATLPPGLTSDRAALRSALSRIQPTAAGGSPSRALALAAERLQAGGLPHREVHIFSDLQTVEWDRTPPSPPGLPPGTAVLVHRVAPAPNGEPNVSLAAVRLPARRIVAGRPCFAEVETANRSDAPAEIRLSSRSAADVLSAQSVTLPPRESRTLAVPIQAATPGLNWTRVWIEDKGMPSDNEAYVACVATNREVAFLLGPAAGALPFALDPDGRGDLSGLTVAAAVPAGLSERIAAERPAFIVAPTDLAASSAIVSTALREFALQGGNVLLLPPTNAAPADAGPAWAGARWGAFEARGEGTPMAALSPQDALWADLRSDAGAVMLHGLKAFRFHPLDLEAGAVPLLGLDDGRVVLSRLRVGRGHVFACGMAFDTGATTLPLKPAFVALAQAMALMTAEPPPHVAALTAGEPLPAPDGRGNLGIATLAGGPLAWSGRAADRPGSAFPGVYEITVGEQRLVASVRAAPREGQATYLEGGQVPALGGRAHTVAAYRDPSTLLASLRRTRTGVDLFLPLILLALLALLVEGWVVNPLPRLAEPATPPAAGGWAARVLRLFRSPATP